MGCAKPHATHWQDLRSRPVELVLDRPGVVASPLDGGSGVGFELPFLVDRYRVDPETERIDALGPDPEIILSDAFQILLLNYLLAPNGGSPTGELISEKELRGGATFFRGPHALPVSEVVARYGSDLAGFESRARELGGTPAEYGDCAMRLQPFPSLELTYILWQADEEFGPSMSALFDRSIGRWFTLDMVFIMAGEISRRLVHHTGS
jgi:Domain of unknown function (DUF3786)